MLTRGNRGLQARLVFGLCQLAGYGKRGSMVYSCRESLTSASGSRRQSLGALLLDAHSYFSTLARAIDLRLEQEFASDD